MGKCADYYCDLSLEVGGSELPAKTRSRAVNVGVLILRCFVKMGLAAGDDTVPGIKETF